MENFITMEKRCWSFYLVFAVIYREALCRMPCTELLRAVDPSPTPPRDHNFKSLTVLVIHSTELHWEGSIQQWRRKMAAFKEVRCLLEANYNACPLLLEIDNSNEQFAARWPSKSEASQSRAHFKCHRVEDWAHSLLMAVSPSLYCWDSSVVLLPLPFR